MSIIILVISNYKNNEEICQVCVISQNEEMIIRNFLFILDELKEFSIEKKVDGKINIQRCFIKL